MNSIQSLIFNARTLIPLHYYTSELDEEYLNPAADSLLYISTFRRAIESRPAADYSIL